MKLGVKLVR